MEECGRGAAVEQLTARGMLSIPAMGGNRRLSMNQRAAADVNPRDGGAIVIVPKEYLNAPMSIPAMGGNRMKTANAHPAERVNPRDGGQ